MAISLFISCVDKSLVSENNSGQVEFYLLSDIKLYATDAAKKELSALQLANEPLFTSEEISYYKWKEHGFYVDTVCAKKIRDVAKANQSVFGIPFVVTVNKERIYLGAFWFLYSSIAPSFPNIDVTFLSSPLQQKFIISPAWTDGTPERRNDVRIYQALKAEGLLIECHVLKKVDY